MSRFGRNTLDMLKILRELRGLGADDILSVKIYGCITSSLKR
ncbi:MAG: recombinase family protein [Clostridiales bacterium]|nr:recombinase family protein [Clostridiales bacterium]